MTTTNIKPSTLPSSHPNFDAIEKGFHNEEVHARIIHFWEARNLKKAGLLMGLELLLIDKKSTIIQAFIAANRIGRFKDQLKPNSAYVIKNFIVADNKISYRVSDHKFLLQFTDQTTLTQLLDVETSIDTQKFRFRTYADFDATADMNVDLYDVIGQLMHINDDIVNSHIANHGKCILEEGKMDERLPMQLKLDDGSLIRVTLWSNVAAAFCKKILHLSTTPIVVLATTMTPRKIGGMLYLNSTSATRIYFDNDVHATCEYLASLGEEDKTYLATNNHVSNVIKPESVTIAELKKFLATENPQKASFTCEATIVDILDNYGWNYIACTKCACKLGRSSSTLICNTCNNPNAIGMLRYRIELLVRDKNHDITTFVIFDRDANKLAGEKAADLLEKITKDDAHECNETTLTVPKCFKDAIGQTFTFQVKVTEYNFSANRQTITVSRMLDTNIGSTTNVLTIGNEVDCSEVLQDIPETSSKTNNKRAHHLIEE